MDIDKTAVNNKRVYEGGDMENENVRGATKRSKPSPTHDSSFIIPAEVVMTNHAKHYGYFMLEFSRDEQPLVNSSTPECYLCPQYHFSF